MLIPGGQAIAILEATNRLILLQNFLTQPTTLFHSRPSPTRTAKELLPKKHMTYWENKWPETHPHGMELFQKDVTSQNVDPFINYERRKPTSVKSPISLQTVKNKSGIVRHDVAQSLIEARKDLVLGSTNENGFTEQDIVANAILMFFAGFEPVSSTLSFCLYQLALNQHNQEEMRDEMNSKVKEHGKINNDFLVDLHYSDMVLAETGRMYGVTNALFRETVKTYQVPGESLVIKKGTRIMIPLNSIHHDSEYYPDPYKFDPQRFSPEKTKRMSDTYLPFGDGPRFCIGKRFAELEMKMVLSQILTTFRVLPGEKTEVPLKFKSGLPLLVSKNGIWLRFQSISK
eukprot:XP_008185222.1 PREDICTED: cytochrome P450 3A19-like [Acyrthosiphon pisum]